MFPFLVLAGLITIGAVVMSRKGPSMALDVSTIEKKRIAGLIPPVALALTALRNKLLTMGIRTHVGSTRRSLSEQEKLAEAGRSATPTSSWHLLGRAIDLYPLLPNGKIDSNGTYLDKFRIMHNEASKLGFKGLAFNPDGSKRLITVKKVVVDAAGAPVLKDGKKQYKDVKIWDGGHIEYTNNMSFAQAQTADRAKGYA